MIKLFYANFIEPFAEGKTLSYYVIIFITYLVLVWMFIFILTILNMLRLKALLKKCTEISFLRQAVTKHFLEGEFVEADSDKNAQEVFKSYCRIKGLRLNSVIGKHINAIFSAGWDGTKLEVGELIKHSSNNLFSINNLLKGVLSTFVIIGLLGTLIGISETLSKLEPLMRSITVEQNNTASKDTLNSMLSQLGSSFRPSILGVACTIVGVLLFTLYIKCLCTNIKSDLDYFTLTIWVPKLVPSTEQKFVSNFQLSEDQIKKSFEVAHRASEFAESMQNETDKLSSNIVNANGILTTMTSALGKFDKFSNSFFKSVSSLTSFQGDIQKLYGKMVEDSQKYQADVDSNIKNLENVQNTIMGYFDLQHKQLKEMLETLKCFEGTYVKQHLEMDGISKNLLLDASKIYKDIEVNSDEVMKTIEGTLVEKLSGIEKTLNYQLFSIVDRFGKFDAPINRAAEKIEGSLESVVNRTETLTKELQREFLAQSQKSGEQIDEVRNLYGKIISFLETVDTAYKASTNSLVPAGNQEEQEELIKNKSKSIFKILSSIFSTKK